MGRRVWHRHLLLIGLTAFGALLRFGFLGQQSFWFDESVTIALVQGSFRHMADALPSSESTPPLYYVLAWGWSKLFGTGEIGLRSLSAVFGTATIPAAFAVGCQYVSRRAGLYAAAIVACSPFLVWYSQEARGYALFGLLSALSVLAIGRAVQHPTWRTCGAWALVACLALATHYFAIFLVGAEAAWILVAQRRNVAAWLSVAATGAAGLALLPLALRQNDTGSTDWITGQPLSRRMRATVREFVSGQYSPRHQLAILGAAAATLLVIGALVWLSDETQRRGAVRVLALGTASLLAPLALVSTRYDKFFYRNLIGSFVVIAIGFGCAFASRRAARFGVVVIGIVCMFELGAVTLTLQRSSLQRDDWRAAMRALSTADGPVAVVTEPWFERSVIAVYRPDVREMPRSGAEVRDIAFVGLGPLPSDFRPPSGFQLVDRQQIQRVTVVRYRAPTPRLVTADDVASGGFSTEGVLLAPRQS
jgi:uncharacterized membrane protein